MFLCMLIPMLGLCLLFDLFIWNGFFYQLFIARVPHSDFYALRKMTLNLRKMVLVKKCSVSHTYRIKGSNFYMVVLGDDLYDLYHAENLEELSHSYSIGGIGLKSSWNSWIYYKMGKMLQKWHTTKGKYQTVNKDE